MNNLNHKLLCIANVFAASRNHIDFAQDPHLHCLMLGCGRMWGLDGVELNIFKPPEFCNDCLWGKSRIRCSYFLKGMIGWVWWLRRNHYTWALGFHNFVGAQASIDIAGSLSVPWTGCFGTRISFGRALQERNRRQYKAVLQAASVLGSARSA